MLDAVRQYRGCTSIALYAAEGADRNARRGRAAGGPDWRVVYRQGEPLGYLASSGGNMIDSSGYVDETGIQELTDVGIPLAMLFAGS